MRTIGNCISLTKVSRLTSIQPGYISPRGFSTSPKLHSSLKAHSSFSFSDSRLHHQYNRTIFTSVSESSMEKFPQDTSEAVNDQMRERICKEGCEYKPVKRVSDSILPHILNLYASRATPQDYEIYTPLATFEDPLMCAHGVKQIKSAFYSLGKVFSESRIVDYTIKENVISPGKTEILIDNKQYYKFLGKDINMISLIKLYTEDGKVVRHEDCWDKKPLWNRETVHAPLVGRIIEVTKRGSMFATHALMRFGKDPST